MSRTQKTLTIFLWTITVLTMVGLIALWPRNPAANGNQPTLSPSGVVYSNGNNGESTTDNGPLPVLWPAPDFTLTDQNNQSISLADFHGHPFICDFIYTHCPGVCPVMTATLSQMQSKLSPDVKLVSFSVDPTNDTPAVFAKYAEAARAEPGRWHFLTGTPAQIFDVGFGMRVMAPNTTVSPLQHNSHFFLVDAAGNVRQMADISYPSEIDAMVRSANALAAAGGGAHP